MDWSFSDLWPNYESLHVHLRFMPRRKQLAGLLIELKTKAKKMDTKPAALGPFLNNSRWRSGRMGNWEAMGETHSGPLPRQQLGSPADVRGQPGPRQRSLTKLKSAMVAEAIRSRCRQGRGTEGIQNWGHREALQAKACESGTQSRQGAQGGKEK